MHFGNWFNRSITVPTVNKIFVVRFSSMKILLFDYYSLISINSLTTSGALVQFFRLFIFYVFFLNLIHKNSRKEGVKSNDRNVTNIFQTTQNSITFTKYILHSKIFPIFHGIRIMLKMEYWISDLLKRKRLISIPYITRTSPFFLSHEHYRLNAK